MADEQIILDVTINDNDAINKIIAEKKAIAEMTASLKEFVETNKDNRDMDEEVEKQRVKTKIAIDESKTAIRQLEKEIKNNNKAQNESADSVVQMRAKLALLIKAYDNLSGEMRKSDEGIRRMNAINELRGQIEQAEQATGRYSRNVGNYYNDIMKAMQSVGGASGTVISGANGINASFKMLLANPIIAVFTGLVWVMNKVASAFSSSEDNANKLASSFSAFAGVGNVVTRMLQALGAALATAAEWLGKVADKWGLVSDEMKVNQQLTKDQIALDKQLRADSIETAKAQNEISKLRAEANQKDMFTIEERLKRLQDASDLELEIADRNQKNAQEQLRILEEKAKLADNSAEENEALAQAQIKVINAETEYFNKSRELNGQMAELRNMATAEEKANYEKRLKARQDYQKKVEDETRKAEDALNAVITDNIEKRTAIEETAYKRKQEAFQKQLTEAGGDVAIQNAINQQIQALEIAHNATMEEIRQSASDARIKQLEDEYKRSGDAVKLFFDNQITDAKINGQDTLQIEYDKSQALYNMLIERGQLEGQTAEQYRSEMLAAELAMATALDNIDKKQLADSKKAADAEIKIEQAKYNSMRQLTASFVGLSQALVDSNTDFAKLTKIVALADIAISTGRALASGIAIASATGPFPLNLAAIATTVATVLTNMTTAVTTVKSAKFATGGDVTGAGTGTSDSIPAMLSNGESVITAQATSAFAPLLSTINQMGGGVPIQGSQSANSIDGQNLLAESFAQAVSDMQLWVSVAEINDTNVRVSELKNIGTI